MEGKQMLMFKLQRFARANRAVVLKGLMPILVGIGSGILVLMITRNGDAAEIIAIAVTLTYHYNQK